MQASRRLFALGLTSVLLAMSLQCASGDCDQYSDCAGGYVCTAGKCVLLPTDAAADSAPDATTDATTDAATDATNDASADTRADTTADTTPLLESSVEAAREGAVTAEGGADATKPADTGVAETSAAADAREDVSVRDAAEDVGDGE